MLWEQHNCPVPLLYFLIYDYNNIACDCCASNAPFGSSTTVLFLSFWISFHFRHTFVICMAAFWPTCWIHDSSFSRVFLFLLQHFFLLCCILLNVLWPLCVFCTLWEQHNRVVEFTINSCFLDVYFFLFWFILLWCNVYFCSNSMHHIWPLCMNASFECGTFVPFYFWMLDTVPERTRPGNLCMCSLWIRDNDSPTFTNITTLL